MARSGSVDMIYGKSGSGKTAALGDAAEFHYERTGKPVFLVNTDPGGWDVLQHLVEAGVVLPYKVVQDRRDLMHDLIKLSKGHRPLDLDNPLSPLSPAPKFDDVSAIFFDGITSTCSMLSEWHVHSVQLGAQAGTITPTSVNIAGIPRENFIISGEGNDVYIRRILGQTDYGEVQRTAREILSAWAMLPLPVIGTALPNVSEDKKAGRVPKGPGFMGQALTAHCGNMFGNLLHLDKQIAKDGSAKFVMWLKDHPDMTDPLRELFPAKVRVPKSMAHKVPASIEPDMKFLYRAIEDLQREARESLAGARKKNESPAMAGASN